MHCLWQCQSERSQQPGIPLQSNSPLHSNSIWTLIHCDTACVHCTPCRSKLLPPAPCCCPLLPLPTPATPCHPLLAPAAPAAPAAPPPSLQTSLRNRQVWKDLIAQEQPRLRIMGRDYNFFCNDGGLSWMGTWLDPADKHRWVGVVVVVVGGQQHRCVDVCFVWGGGV